jgi:MFS family permease
MESPGQPADDHLTASRVQVPAGQAPPVRPTGAERRALAVVFLAHGAWMGTFASRLPWIAERLHMDSGLLGAVGLAASVGALTAMPLSARFLHRYGAKSSTRVLIAASGLALVLPPLAPNVAVLTLMLLAGGALIGTADNAMNAQGVDAEQRAGKTILSGLHGMWSVGVLAGALGGSLAARSNLDPRIQFAVVGALIALAGLVAPASFAGGPRATDGADVSVPRFVWPRGVLLLMGLIAFAAVFVEIATNDWAAVFLRWELHTSQAEAALGTSVFALTMAAGRLCGDVVVRRIGAVLSVRISGSLGVAGCVLVAVAPDAIAAMAGFMLIGIGVSVVVPLVFTASGRTGPNIAIGVAGVATVSYGAGLAAPSVMGAVAELTSLRVAFAITAVIALAVAAGAGLLGRDPRSAAERDLALAQAAD